MCTKKLRTCVRPDKTADHGEEGSDGDQIRQSCHSYILGPGVWGTQSGGGTAYGVKCLDIFTSVFPFCVPSACTRVDLIFFFIMNQTNL